MPTLKIPTRHLHGFVSRAYANRDCAARHTLYQAMSKNPCFASSAGYLLETCVLLWLRHSPAQDYLSCVPATGHGSPELRIPACGEKMQFIREVGDLKCTNENERPMCLVPVSKTFPTCDAIILTNEFVITVQITVASTHHTNDIGCEKVHGSIPKGFSDTRTRCHVFVTDTKDKATSLRSQYTTTTKNIQFYFIFINVNMFNSILTSERVDALEKDKVSRLWLSVNDIYFLTCRKRLLEVWVWICNSFFCANVYPAEGSVDQYDPTHLRRHWRKVASLP